MVAIGAVLVVVSLSVLATRLGAIALGATGLSWDTARFQARSAFTGVGFTTSEAESITDHAARRRVVSWLMFLGNAGIVSIIASLVLGFSDAGAREATQRLGVLVAGLLVLLALLTELDDRPQGSEGESEHDRSVSRHTRQQAQEAADDGPDG